MTPVPISNDDRVFDAVADLVRRGEYLDQVPGVPEPTTERGGSFRVLPDGTYAPMYDRGSDEFLAAKAEGRIAPLPVPPFPPAEPRAVDDVERSLGHPLPPLLRRLYLEVANGGFGPGYGLLGLEGGHGVAPDGNAIDRLRRFREWEPDIAPGLFPICDWGCAITSFVDCADPSATIWALDPNPLNESDELVDGIVPTELDLTAWLQRWIDGHLHQPWTIEDPDTGRWRAATVEETDRAFREP